MTKWQTVAALIGLGLGGAAMAQDYTPVPPQIDGEISQADGADGQGRRFDEYAVELGRGDAVVLTVSPAAGSRLQPAIEVFAGDAARPLASDGADPGSRDARLTFTASEAGVFRVRILGGTAAAGRYALRLRRAQAAAPRRGVAIGAVGGSILGQAQGGGSAPAGPRERYIICPGHRSCPR